MKQLVPKYKWDRVKRAIENSRKILMTTHINPDGDGLGCEAAMYYFLKKLGKDPVIYNSSDLPPEYEFLNREGMFKRYIKQMGSSVFKGVDLIMVFDIGTPDRLGCIGEYVSKSSILKICVDHHPNKHGNFDIEIVDPDAPSVTFMIFDLIKCIDSSLIDYPIAEALYVGLLTDTGSFRFENTTIEALKMAIEMLEHGVKPGQVYRQIYENLRPIQAKLLGYVLQHLHYELSGKVAWFSLTREEIKSEGAKLEDVDGFTDFVRSIKDVEVSVMFLELDDKKIKVNFRSKGRVAVNGIANRHGGGGHPYAAGMLLQMSISEAIGLVLEEVFELFGERSI